MQHQAIVLYLLTIIDKLLFETASRDTDRFNFKAGLAKVEWIIISQVLASIFAMLLVTHAKFQEFCAIFRLLVL